MNVLPIWQPALAAVPKQPDVENLFGVPRSRNYYAKDISFVRTATEAEAMLQLVMERPLSHAGFDTEYRYGNPPTIARHRERYDVRCVEPLLLSLCLVEPSAHGEILYRFVVDLGSMEVLPSLGRIFMRPLSFAAHFAKGDLFCLWQLGLPEPQLLWDTCVAEKALNLGHGHVRYKVTEKDVSAEIEAKSETEAVERMSYSLVETCRRYEVPMENEADKGTLQRSFLDYQPGTPFTEEQIAYAAEDAVAVAKLYPQQVLATARQGCLHHLETVEHPWTITIARMEWTGIRVDEELARQVRTDCEEQLPHLEEKLKNYGLGNASSNPQVREFFRRINLLHLFAGRDGEKFEKSLLKRYADRHPAIPLIIEYRQKRTLLTDGILDSTLKGADDRYHPEQRQLGTHTGRQTSKNPNILGLPGSMRPLVIPEEGKGIGEVDLCQIEVGVTAAMYGDDALVRLSTRVMFTPLWPSFFTPTICRGKRWNWGARSLRRLIPNYGIR